MTYTTMSAGPGANKQVVVVEQTNERSDVERVTSNQSTYTSKHVKELKEERQLEVS